MCPFRFFHNWLHEVKILTVIRENLVLVAMTCILAGFVVLVEEGVALGLAVEREA